MKYFSKRISLLLVLLLVISTMLSGCGGGAKTGDTATTASKPKIGGVAVSSYGSAITMEWDPALMYSDSLVIYHNTYETLLYLDANTGKIDPLLATEYSTSTDGLTWTFKLRKGVKFHDGTDMTAEDVKFSIDRTMKIGKGAAFIWDPVKEIKIVDDYTLEFLLKYPTPLDLIATSSYAAYIYSKDAADKDPEGWFNGKETGSGPYKLDSAVDGDQFIMSRFDQYWKGWDGNHLEKVVVKCVLEVATRRQMIEAGDLDVSSLPAEDLKAIAANPNVEQIQLQTYTNTAAYMNTQKPPLDNKLVRQAISYAFPYDNVVEHAMGGLAEQTRGVLPSTIWGYSDEILQYKYDLEKAKALLSEAGHPNGGFKLIYTYIAGCEDMKKAAEMFKSELAKLNIELEIRGMPWDSEWAMAKSENVNDRQDLMCFRWWPDVVSPVSWLQALYHSEKDPIFNLSYYNNPDVDKLIDDGIMLTGTDREAATKKFIEAQKIIMEAAPVIPQYDHTGIILVNKKLKGAKFNHAYNNSIYFYNCYKEE